MSNFNTPSANPNDQGTPLPSPADDTRPGEPNVTAERYPDGYRVARRAVQDWGLLVEDDATYARSLSEQFATEVGPGEAVEHSELWELVVAVAQAAYAAGRDEGL